jgi:ectoine hydroxylase-related dioxygenase (phytanoyl-CoA dioxygenase family)
MKELNGSGMVEAYHNQTLWDNRQTPRVVDAFVDIWDRQDLWVTIDRANLNTPNKGKRKFGGFIHWDADTTLDPLPVNVQGVLALSDTSPESGGFQCYPELFNLLAWRKSVPQDRNPWQPDLATVPYPMEFIAMKKGELLIFNSLLAHGIRPNTSTDQVRLAQYISFTPAQQDNQSCATGACKAGASAARAGLRVSRRPRGQGKAALPAGAVERTGRENPRRAQR